MYQILLEGKQVKNNQITSIHIMAGLLLLVMGFITWLVPNSIKQKELNFLNYAGLGYVVIGIIIITATIFFNRSVLKQKVNKRLRIFEIIVFIPILIYSIYQKWYLPLGYATAALIGIILAYYFETRGKVNKTAHILSEGIKIAGLGKHSNMPWSEIKNIIIKYNILTIDRYDNKLYQLPLVKNTTNDFETIENYSKQQIIENKGKKEEDW